MLNHMAFMECLEHLEGEDRTVVLAGLVVLRFLDSVEDSDPDDAVDTVASMAEIIGAIPDAYVQARYALVGLMAAAVRLDKPAVISELLRYATVLERLGKFTLAADTYETATWWTSNDRPQREHNALRSVLWFNHARVLRNAGNFERAEQSYRSAIRYAVASKDRAAALAYRIHQAELVRAKGNLLDADATLTGLLAEAQAAHRPDLIASCLRSRASTRQRRKLLGAAIQDLADSYAAAPGTQPGAMALVDLAACLAEAGLWGYAKRIHAFIEATTTEGVARAVAVVNQIELAAWEGDELAFQRTRRRFEVTPMSEEQRLAGHLYIGDGLARFGQREDALEALSVCVGNAERAGAYHIAFEARSRLERLQEADALPPIRREAVAPEDEHTASQVVSRIERTAKVRRTQKVESVG